jgi:imidazolonepropionase-like amidohydrolase
MVTVNPAMALHREKMIGRIRPGFCADLIAIPCGRDADLFEEIVGFEGQVDWMMLNGRL